MAFGWFKKKEVVDLRKGQSDIVVSDDVKKRFANQQTLNEPPANAASTSAPSPSSQESGGFFSFFGSSNAGNVSSMPSPPSATSDAISYSGSDNGDKIESLNKRIDELSLGISRLTDRVDLNERKIERLERRTGVSESA